MLLLEVVGLFSRNEILLCTLSHPFPQDKIGCNPHTETPNSWSCKLRVRAGIHLPQFHSPCSRQGAQFECRKKKKVPAIPIVLLLDVFTVMSSPSLSRPTDFAIPFSCPGA